MNFYSGLAIRSPLIASTLAASLFFLILSFIVTSCVLPSMFPFPVDHAKTKDEVDERESKHKLTDLPSTGNTRPRSSSTTLRLRRSKLTRRRSSTSRNVSWHYYHISKQVLKIPLRSYQKWKRKRERYQLLSYLPRQAWLRISPTLVHMKHAPLQGRD